MESDAAAPSETSSETPAPKPDAETKDGKEEEGETALLPKSILAGKEFKPGEEVVLKIVHMYDDEVEVAYATGEEKDENSKPADMGDEMSKSLSSMGGY